VSASSRLLFGFAVQLAFLGLAIYLVVSPDALPGASHAARVGVAALALAVGVLWGEVMRVRADLGELLRALQRDLSTYTPRDDRMAVDVLVAALDSKDPAAREKAHLHLRRLTGQNLPPDGAAWRAWWQGARATFGPAPRAGSGGAGRRRPAAGPPRAPAPPAGSRTVPGHGSPLVVAGPRRYPLPA
jgi:hypothetical protein